MIERTADDPECLHAPVSDFGLVLASLPTVIR